jgi:hypothetical protein
MMKMSPGIACRSIGAERGVDSRRNSETTPKKAAMLNATPAPMIVRAP